MIVKYQKEGFQNDDSNTVGKSPTGYQKRTAQILGASHVCSVDNFIAFGFK